MTKKKYCKKSHVDCRCCGWKGRSDRNMRKWLGRYNHD